MRRVKDGRVLGVDGVARVDQQLCCTGLPKLVSVFGEESERIGPGGRVDPRCQQFRQFVVGTKMRGEKRVEDALHDLGVRTVVIPRKGTPGQARRTAEHRPAFRRTIKWRTGCEERISTLKRQYGWDRTRLDTAEGAQIWTGHGVLAHNLVKISAPSPYKTQAPAT